MSGSLEGAGRRLARVATEAVVARPALWKVFRPALRAQFDRLAPTWEERHTREETDALLEAALAKLEREPKRILDVGTGTGRGARVAARRFSAAEVVGVDMSARMIEEARRLLPPDLDGRVRFLVADACALPFPDGSFDLVTLLNMIPFFRELGRVAGADANLVFSSSSGPETPIYVPPAKLRAALAPLGFDSFREVVGGGGTALVAGRSRREAESEDVGGSSRRDSASTRTRPSP